jgi:hypothetical protein
MRNISEKLIQFTNRLLDIPDLRLPFDDQRFLEINLVLAGEP